jgi:hypothetical protein
MAIDEATTTSDTSNGSKGLIDFLRRPTDEASKVAQTLKARLVQNFRLLGLISLRHRQSWIFWIRRSLVEMLQRASGKAISREIRLSGDPEASKEPRGYHETEPDNSNPIHTVVEDNEIDKVIWDTLDIVMQRALVEAESAETPLEDLLQRLGVEMDR